jgi:Arc/MetJ-type ribon-helix-helix transcriptional regulator
MQDHSEKVTIRLPTRFVKALDFLVEVDDFPSRSEAIRAAIRDLVYQRVELVSEKLRKIREAEQALANIQDVKKEFLRQ